MSPIKANSLVLGLRVLWAIYRAKWRVAPLIRLVGLKPRMHWREVNLVVQWLAADISRYGPEVYVGVGVGGTVMAAMLAGNCEDGRFIALDREVRYDPRRSVTLYDAPICEDRRLLLSGKRLLVVQGEIVRGDTSKEVEEYLREFSPSEIRHACIDFHSVSSVSPDFYYIETNAVVPKPWEVLSTYRNPDELRRPR